MASSSAGPSNPIPNVSRFQSQPISDAGSNLLDPYDPTHIAADVNGTADEAEYVSAHYLSPVSSVEN